jgi:hypothetical protein
MGQDHDDAIPPGQARVGAFRVALGTPRRLPRAAELPGRVAVVDIAFASESGGRKNGFERTTLRFIDKLGDRLVAWVDHHDSRHHARFAADPRFTLATKAEHGACPEMITPARVRAAGGVDTLVCHDDFDGLASAAKWIVGGEEPYPGCDADARAIDTRVGLPGPLGARIDRALRARRRDQDLALAVVALLSGGMAEEPIWRRIDAAGRELLPLEEAARQLAEQYEKPTAELCIVDASALAGRYDRTLLLLLGQERARMAAVVDRDTVTFAAPYDSGVSFLEAFGLSGGMPTLVSIHKSELAAALVKLGVDPVAAASFG